MQAVVHRRHERGRQDCGNPNIGYGARTSTYADGSSREFYRIGLSANTTGISVYVPGLDDKTYLARKAADEIGEDPGRLSFMRSLRVIRRHITGQADL